MSKTLIIAEKPAMGRDIADALSHSLGKPVARDGLAQIVGQYTIIGAQGHLFALSDAEKYGTQFSFPWKVDPLPVLPDTFMIEPNFEKKNGSIVNSDLTKSIRDRLAKIKTLIKDADTVVHAGDPDREGQLIIDDVLREFKFKGPVKRLWLHAQTRDGIQDAFQTMKSNKDYESLGLAAIARRESDWAIGINATRAYSSLWWKKGNKGVLNIGRVVTPVVGMVVQREKDIKAFIPVDHYTLRATITIGSHDPFNAAWVKPTALGASDYDPSGKLIINKSLVEAVLKKCHGQPATITLAEKKPKKESPPLLFSLTELQKMAAKMGYSPDDVLKAAQSLYEKHKLTSYPRSDCQYAPESERKKAQKVFEAIEKNFGQGWEIPIGFKPTQKSRAWDDSKLAEHYAIIPLPTLVPLSNLTPIERDVYRLVCRQYLAQFFPDYEYMATTIVAVVAGEKFKATGAVPTIDGWRVLYGGGKAVAKQSGNDEHQESLPNVQLGDAGIADPIEIVAKKTEPPKRFTAITLLEAMEKAYLFVTDPKVKATLKEVEGLGTAATRASIIAKMVSAGFATETKVGKVISYAPTEKAFVYINSVPDVLAKPDLTAWFEGKLEELAKGSLAYEKYREILGRLVQKAIESAKDGSALGKMAKVVLTTPVAAATKSTKESVTRRATKRRDKK